MNQLFLDYQCIESNIINTFCISSNSEYCYFIFCNGYEFSTNFVLELIFLGQHQLLFLVSLQQNWAGALLQVLLLILGIFIYMPFIKIMDKQYLEEEANMQNDEEEEDDISLDDLSFDDL